MKIRYWGILYIPEGRILMNFYSKDPWLFNVRKIAEDHLYHPRVSMFSPDYPYKADTWKYNNFSPDVVVDEFEVIEVEYDYNAQTGY